MADASDNLKILVIGEEHSGKSYLLSRFTEGNAFEPHPSQRGIGCIWEVRTRMVRYMGRRVEISAWGVIARMRRASMLLTHLPNTRVILLVYDVSNQSALSGLRLWLNDLLSAVHEHYLPGVGLILVGTKSDLPRQVNRSEAENLATSLGIAHIETSAVEDINVTETFMMAAKLAEPFLNVHLGLWKWSNYSKMPRNAQIAVRTLFLSARRSSELYERICIDEKHSDDNLASSNFSAFDRMGQFWKSFVQRINRVDKTIAVPRLPLEMWFSVLSNMEVSDLGSARKI